MQWTVLNDIFCDGCKSVIKAADVPAGCVLHTHSTVYEGHHVLNVAEALLYVPHCTVEMLQRDHHPSEVVSNAK